MAGGRRPANFANSTTRHTPSDHSFYSIWQNPHIPTTGVASPTAQVRPSTLPSNISMPALTVLPTTMPGDSLAFGGSGVNADALTPADALAAALDTAVSAAVSRVLASKQSVPVNALVTADENDHAESVASSSYNHVIGEGSGRSSTSAEETSAVLEAQIDACNEERKQDISDLRNALAQLEQQLLSTVQDGNRQTASLEKRLVATEKSLAESVANERKHSAECASLREQLKASQKSLNELRYQKRKSESDAERTRSRLAAVEVQFEAYGQKIDGVGDGLATLEHTVQNELRVDHRVAAPSKDDSEQVAKAVTAAEQATRSSNEVLESISGIRVRLKRLESTCESRSKLADESFALQGGAVDTLRGSLNDTSASVQALKRLVEANLRSHFSAEGIVKDQAQLITRHVCVALRQFISRQITENNKLIDTILRARIPAYAEAGDEFVLVREHEREGQADSDLSSASVSQGNERQGNVAVLRHDVLGTALGDLGETCSTSSQK